MLCRRCKCEKRTRGYPVCLDLKSLLTVPLPLPALHSLGALCHVLAPLYRLPSWTSREVALAAQLEVDTELEHEYLVAIKEFQEYADTPNPHPCLWTLHYYEDLALQHLQEARETLQLLPDLWVRNAVRNLLITLYTRERPKLPPKLPTITRIYSHMWRLSTLNPATSPTLPLQLRTVLQIPLPDELLEHMAGYGTLITPLGPQLPWTNLEYQVLRQLRQDDRVHIFVLEYLNFLLSHGSATYLENEAIRATQWGQQKLVFQNDLALRNGLRRYMLKLEQRRLRRALEEYRKNKMEIKTWIREGKFTVPGHLVSNDRPPWPPIRRERIINLSYTNQIGIWNSWNFAVTLRDSFFPSRLHQLPCICQSCGTVYFD